MFYLAVTAAEFANFRDNSQNTAFMACHFCPSSSGLSNIPEKLPPDSLLLLDDSTPPAEHDPARILEQLSQAVRALGCAGIYLDFQRRGYPLLARIAQGASALACPVAVSQLYSEGNSLAVVLPPPPLDTALASYLAPWQSRKIWLEVAPDSKTLTLTRDGCRAGSPEEIPAQGFYDGKLCCHYSVRTEKDAAVFSLWRTFDDILALNRRSESLGVVHTLGLYQELKNIPQRRKPL